MTFVIPTVEIAFATAPGAPPTYTDVTAYVRSLSIRRGRQDLLSRFEAGTSTVTLDNRDRRFEPGYAGEMANAVSNPSVETATTGWVGNGTSIARSTEQAKFGTYSLKCTATAEGRDGVEYDYAPGGNLPITPMTASVWMYAPADLVGKVGAMCISWRGPDGSFLDTEAIVTLVEGWQRIVFANQIPDTATRAHLVMFPIVYDIHIGQYFYLDGLQLERATAVSDYCDGSLDNCRWSGAAHASSSYRGGPYYPNILPMRRLRVSAPYDATTYYLFAGFTEGWPPTYPGNTDGTVTVSAVDGFKALALRKLSASYGAELSGTRFANVLDSAGWPAADRALAAGQSTMIASSLDKKAALEHLQEVEYSENGRFFISGDGKVTFHDRSTPLAAPYTESQGGFGDLEGALPVKDLVLAYDDSRLANEVICTREGGVAQTATDATSQTAYLTRTLERSGLLLSTDNEALSAAQYLLAAYKEPSLRAESITLAPLKTDALWPHVLGRELGDRISLRFTPPGGGEASSHDYLIQGIEHDIGPSSWQTRWRTDTADMSIYWLLGTSELGTDTKLSY